MQRVVLSEVFERALAVLRACEEATVANWLRHHLDLHADADWS